MNLKAFIGALFAFILLNCHIDKDQYDAKNNQSEGIRDSHQGAWELVYFRSIHHGDTTVLKADHEPLAITLLTREHFSYQWRNSSNSGAGSYTYDGKIIEQEFTYVNDSAFTGAVLSFHMTVQNDSLFFSGPVKAVSASGDDLLLFIPQMTEIRKRVE